MRLWSTVVNQPATRPRIHGAGYWEYVSVLTATRGPLPELARHVRDQRIELGVVPTLSNGGHRASAGVEDPPDLLGIRRAARERRSDQALAFVAVARGACPLPGLLAQACLRPPDPAVVLGLGHGTHARVHQCVLRTAVLGALALVEPRRLGFEPERVHLPRDRVLLAGEPGHPPRVDDVVDRGGQLELDDAPDRDAELVDRHAAVGVDVVPVELATLDLDLDLLTGRVGVRRIGDAGQLVEDKAADDDEDQHGDDRPDDLEPVMPDDLRPFDLATAASAAVAQDEQE